jgi:hypothetical protein
MPPDDMPIPSDDCYLNLLAIDPPPPPPSFIDIPILEALFMNEGIPGREGAACPPVFEISFFMMSIRPWPSSSDEFIPLFKY